MMNKACGACQIEKAQDKYSNAQYKKKNMGRCYDCCQKQVPVNDKVLERAMLMQAESRKRSEERSHLRELEYERRCQEWENRELKKLQFRCEHPVTPPHPDEGKWKKWKPEQTMKIESGGFCFGLRNDLQVGANTPLVSFAEMAQMSSSNNTGQITTNSIAKNGTWNAYKISVREPAEIGSEDYVGGWLVVHENYDPVVEIRQMFLDSFADELGGAEVGCDDGREGTHGRHKELGLIVIPRYVIGTVYQFSEEVGNRVKEEGIYFVDHQQARASTNSSKENWTNNSIRGMHSDGDFDVARLAYDQEDGLCKSFLLWGNDLNVKNTYFGKGTAPMGQAKWELECSCPHHGFSDRRITVEEYLKKSGTTLCSNRLSFREATIQPLEDNPDKPNVSKTQKANASTGNSRAPSRSPMKNVPINTKTSNSGATKKRKPSSTAFGSSRTKSTSTGKQPKITDFFKK